MPAQFENQDSQNDMNTNDQAQSQDQSFAGGQQGAALDTIRTSVVGVLDSVVREYEPQIAEFTSNIAHQAVDRGVELAQTAVQRVKTQSWMRLAAAAALGIGAIAVLAYEAEQISEAQGSKRSRRQTH